MYGRRIPQPGRVSSGTSIFGSQVYPADRGIPVVSLYPAALDASTSRPIPQQSIGPIVQGGGRTPRQPGGGPPPISGFGMMQVPVDQSQPITVRERERIAIRGGLPEPVGGSIFGQPVYATNPNMPQRAIQSYHGFGAMVPVDHAQPITVRERQAIAIRGGLPEPVGGSIFGQPVYGTSPHVAQRPSESYHGFGGIFGAGPDGLG